MARTHSQTISCPNCSASLELEVATALNAERSPGERVRILDGSFQLHGCECGAQVRFEAPLSYMDLPRKQWIVLEPYPKLSEWSEREDRALKLFELAFGDGASAAAREFGAGVSPRVVFGWAALREKLVLQDLGLDDVTLECTKLALMKQEKLVPEAGKELRLMGLKGVALEIAVIRPQAMQAEGGFGVPRGYYDGIEANQGEWAVMRQHLEGGAFVDAQRLYMDALPAQ